MMNERIKVGLYYLNGKGEKVTPTNLYFSADLRKWLDDETQINGRCYTHIPEGLFPVYTPNGEQFIIPEYDTIVARYRSGVIFDIHKD